jgi:uncharacterized protein YutE (UPF0331/DUF86 family)
MVDEARVLALLRSVRADLTFLGREAHADAVRRADEAWLRGVKYAFVTAIEGCVDVAQHLAASESWGAPATNAAAVRLLGRHGVLDPDLADRLGRAVGFRNVLVHDYVEVDDTIVLDRLADHADLDAFVVAVLRWLDTARA